jgi:hypothetical protein
MWAPIVDNRLSTPTVSIKAMTISGAVFVMANLRASNDINFPVTGNRLFTILVRVT